MKNFVAYIYPSLVAIVALPHRIQVVWNAITDVSKDAPHSPINSVPLLTSVSINVGNTRRNFVKEPCFRHTSYISFIIFNYFRHFVNFIYYTSSIRVEESGKAPFSGRNRHKIIGRSIRNTGYQFTV